MKTELEVMNKSNFVYYGPPEEDYVCTDCYDNGELVDWCFNNEGYTRFVILSDGGKMPEAKSCNVATWEISHYPYKQLFVHYYRTSHVYPGDTYHK
jgi:hypothetical protein